MNFGVYLITFFCLLKQNEIITQYHHAKISLNFLPYSRKGTHTTPSKHINRNPEDTQNTFLHEALIHAHALPVGLYFLTQLNNLRFEAR